jgi:hypothetical protein
MSTPTSASIHRSRPRRTHARGRVDFAAINCAALPLLPTILQRVLPRGRRIGHEWVAINPTRADRHAGSFKVNVRSGKWGDFATNDRGSDPVSLIAYLESCSQVAAAKKLARMLGTAAGARSHG